MVMRGKNVSFGLSLAFSLIAALFLNHLIDARNMRIIEAEVALTQGTTSRTMEMLYGFDDIYQSSLEAEVADAYHQRSLLALKQQVAGQVAELSTTIALIEKTGKNPRFLHLCRQLRGACIELLETVDGHLQSPSFQEFHVCRPEEV